MSPEEKHNRSRDFYWYHCVDLGDGVITDGDYDIRDFVEHYKIPNDMRGLAVLDVGRASGAFAFEFERRGARVVAVDLKSAYDWDFVGGDIHRAEHMERHGDWEPYSRLAIWGAFDFAREVRGSNVEPIFCNAYDLNPDVFGGRKFDITFMGSVTSHLRDPMKVLYRFHIRMT
jgi:tRNA (mo5U34)-methyltransferase